MGRAWHPVAVWAAAAGVTATALGAVVLHGGQTAVRPPAIAGAFYPAAPEALRAAVAGYLTDAVPVRPAAPRVLVVPHAAFPFSGQIAADAFRQTGGRTVETVIILGTNHTRGSFQRASVYDGDAWQTPLGRVPVNTTLARAIVEAGIGAVFDTTLHTTEHSIEVQLPFIQVLHPAATIVPIVVGSPDPALCRRLGREIARLANGQAILIVASTDLAHYPSASDARRLDRDLIEGYVTDDGGGHAIAAERSVRDGEAIPVPGLSTRACGLGPLLVAREAARALGAGQTAVLSYANSADSVLATADRAVGYAAIMFADGPAQTDTSALARPKPEEKAPLDADDKRMLLRLARETITRRLASETLPLPRGGSARLLREAGAFVTLESRGALRGCIGRVLPEGPLIRLVSAMALESAFADARFAPVKPADLKGIEIEISVLTKPRDVSRVDEIETGRDGVLFRLGDKGAVLLPQVIDEEGWTRAELLEHLALKAGLHASAWRDRKARLQTFQADVFSEKDLRVSVR